jgi:hypothetical protein
MYSTTALPILHPNKGRITRAYIAPFSFFFF